MRNIAGLCCCCLFSAIVYSLSLNISDQVRADTAPVRGGALPNSGAWGRRAASSLCMRMIDTSQTLLLTLIGHVDPGAMDSCKSKYSHRVEPQTADFYTADLYLILSDHNYNLSKYDQKIVTDYIWDTILSLLHIFSQVFDNHIWGIIAKNVCLSADIKAVTIHVPVTDTVYRAEIWWGVGRTGGRKDIQLRYFSLLPKTVTVTTLLLFGSVTLLCGTFLCIKLSEGSVQLTDHQIDTPSTILHLWYYQTSIIYIGYWNVT